MRRGVLIPEGALDVYRAAKAQAKAGTGLCHIAVWGDSTTFGTTDAGTSPFYPWPARLRELLLGEGIPDGGFGVYEPGIWALARNATHPSADCPTIPTMTATANSWTKPSGIGQNYFCSNVIGDSFTMTGLQGTNIRLTIGKRPNGSVLTYQVDGGTVVTKTCQPVAAPPPRWGYDGESVLISGLSDTSHTLTVTNSATPTIKGPNGLTFAKNANRQMSTNASPLLPSTPYYYGITAVSANGESAMMTVPGSPFTTGPSGGQFTLAPWAEYGWTGYRLYRSTSPTTGFVLAAEKTGLNPDSPNTSSLLDDGTASGAAPPSSSTLGSYAAGVNAIVRIEVFRDTGLLLSNHAVYGAGLGSFVSTNFGVNTETDVPTLLGGVSSNSLLDFRGDNMSLPESGGPSTWWTGRSTDPARPHPHLLIVNMGINEIGSNDVNGTTYSNSATWFEWIGYLARICRAWGIDLLICGTVFKTGFNPQGERYVSRYRQALTSACLSYGVAFYDFYEAMGYDVSNWVSRGYLSDGAHMSREAYQAEALGIWQSVLRG